MTINISEPMIYEGGCHCSAVRFRVVVKQHKVDDCNCSICRKKGFLHLIIPKEQFTLLQGENKLITYQFNTGVAQHKFCSICGIHSFYIPRSHPDCIDVNVRCLDGDVISNFEVVPFDGMNWEANIHKLIN
ncbi:glutathione-dependent formaldehyde-activating GFA [Anabaenopsis circularis NIES-21]|uniref:Glutathione-dependent formaldehyde-activating GFA n=2 Tax=Nostocales TaxID=1161 RepID=A0A1Z4GA57_9CYAN|nr:GFA family protein [Nostoc cycadae]BAY14369.1 glutathione-dependent formaldehyde-activating GFA [Anabaenopsis circularis NIES-21]GBE95015.1 glutathione-dependent formaldehyde-activating protein [Nostoc cycadae WK-1]